MIKTERHNIKGNKDIVYLCSLSKDLYNQTLYYVRQAYFSKERLPDLNTLNNLTKDLDCYKNFNNTKISKQIIRKVLSDFSNYRKALRAYNKDSSKFLSKPKPPKYKKKLSQVIFYNETISKTSLKHNIIQPTNKCFSVKSNIKTFKQVVVTPKAFGFIVDIQYEVNEENIRSNDNFCSIDIGVNNLCSITSNQTLPVLINGRIVKSINQYYNRNNSQKNLKKRYFRIENYFHHVSKFIINYCKTNNISKIIIGKNDNWKQKTKLCKKNSQNFQHIPFNKLIEKIVYKANLVGIDVILTEESYTSKCSFIDKEEMKHQEKYLGRRLKRGLFRSSEGILINADVNGSLNIGRKVIGEKIYDFLTDRSVAATPVKVNPLRKISW